MSKPGVKKILKYLLLAFLLFSVLSCLMTPLLQKSGGSRRKKGDDAAALSQAVCTERILCIDDNVEALEWRLRAIREAEEEICLSTFTFSMDNSGQDMAAALMEAADRGVSIRILLDGVGPFPAVSTGAELRALAAMPQVEVKIYITRSIC